MDWPMATRAGVVDPGQLHQTLSTFGVRSVRRQREVEGCAGIHLTFRPDPAAMPANDPLHSWAQLIKKVYEADPLICPRRGGSMRIMALIDQPEVIEKILTYLGLGPMPPMPLPAGPWPS